jgi:hypothetical protein
LASEIRGERKRGIDGIMAYCKYCDAEITFDDRHTSQRIGKKIPLDVETEEPHKCAVWKLKNRRYLNCNKGCGGQIFFDEDRRTESGKWIPIDKDTDEPHQCKGFSGGETEDE